MKRKLKLKEECIKWKKWSERVNKKINTGEHIVIIGIGCLISSFFYLTCIKLLPIRFTPQKTETINWLTINKYPKQQDYYIFISAIGFIYLFTLLIWFITVYLKSKK